MAGTYIDSKGYLTFVAGPQRGQRVHRLIAKAMLGRELRKDEVVHHKDGNKLNNDPSNLKVMNVKDHNAVSAKQRWYLQRLAEHEQQEWKEYFEDSIHGSNTEV